MRAHRIRLPRHEELPLGKVWPRYKDQSPGVADQAAASSVCVRRLRANRESLNDRGVHACSL